MSKPVLLRKKAKIVALIVFLLGLLLLTFTGAWWPGIMLVVGLPLAIHQYIQGRMYDMYITLFVFIGAFVTVQFNIQWEVFLPVLFAIGGIYIFFREWLMSRKENDEEIEENKNEISEKDDDEE
jgi:predicted membrane protein